MHVFSNRKQSRAQISLSQNEREKEIGKMETMNHLNASIMVVVFLSDLWPIHQRRCIYGERVFSLKIQMYGARNLSLGLVSSTVVIRDDYGRW